MVKFDELSSDSILTETNVLFDVGYLNKIIHKLKETIPNDVGVLKNDIESNKVVKN